MRSSRLSITRSIIIAVIFLVIVIIIPLSFSSLLSARLFLNALFDVSFAQTRLVSRLLPDSLTLLNIAHNFFSNFVNQERKIWQNTCTDHHTRSDCRSHSQCLDE